MRLVFGRFAALVGVLCAATSVAAHDAPPEKSEQAPAEAPDDASDPQGQDTQVLVRGERAPRAASGVVRDRALLGAAPQATGSELLRAIPGVFVSQHGGPGKAHQIFFRGFDAVHGQDLELWVGGAPVNEVSHIHGQGYADLHFVLPEVVRRIDALPGAYDPSQGDFAVAGTMRFSLGYEEPGVTVQGGAGSFGARRMFLAYHPAAAPAETFGAFELFRSDGFGAARASERATAVAQLLHPLGDDLTFRVLASSYAGRFGSAGVVRQDDVERGAIGRFDTYDSRQGGASTRTQWVAEILHDDGQAEFGLSPYVVVRHLTLRYNYTGYLVRPGQGDLTEQVNDALTAGLRARYRRVVELLRADDALELGVAARNDWIDQRQSYLGPPGDPAESLVDARVRATTLSGYADAELHPVSRVVVRGGLRADVASFGVEDGGRSGESQGSFVGEKLVTDVALARRLHAVGSWGRGFRSPQARSVPEGARPSFTEVRSAELGMRWEDARQRASVASYWTALSNDLVFDETVGRNEAAPATERIGLAANLESAVGWFVSGVGATATRASFRETRGRFVTGQLVPYVPQVVARADLAARPRLGTLGGETLHGHFGLGVQGLFRRPLPYGGLGRDAVITDVRLGVRTERLELTLDVRNVFDLEWNDGEFAYASSFDPTGPNTLLPARHFSAGEPANVFLSAALHL